MSDVADQVPAPRTEPSAPTWVNSPVADTDLGDASNHEPSSTVTATWSPLAAVPKFSSSAIRRNVSVLCAAWAAGVAANAATATSMGAIHRLMVPSLFGAGMRAPGLGGHRDPG